MEFIEAPAFTRHLQSHLDDDGYRRLQNDLAAQPELGDVIQGTGGFGRCKVRWADARRGKGGKGRRGGLRLIYYYFEADQQIWLMTLYGKNEQDDLSPSEKKALRSAIDQELAARHARRHRRK